MDGQVHRRARRHQSLQEAGGEGTGPLAQVEGADHAVSDAHVAPVDLDLDLLALVHVGRRAAKSGRYEEHPKLAASQGVDGQPGPRKQAPQLVDAGELAHGVEAPVEDAVAGLKVGEEASEGLGGGLRLRGQVVRLGLLQLLPHPAQARRVLAAREAAPGSPGR